MVCVSHMIQIMLLRVCTYEHAVFYSSITRPQVTGADVEDSKR